MSASSSPLGTFQRVDEIVRSEHNLWEHGTITAREAVEQMIAALTLLDGELRVAEREAALDREVAAVSVPVTDEALWAWMETGR